ncbi:SART-1 family protein DOT2 [Iris pallida]|uniref:SART-1 family protein DOT2 n=1 Tax=Iris pallida TaxID=29817 RepID=A0AAX6GJ54_IRIPA|nr:SART-1 family protein DOT2 [Iris pallida]
MGRDEEGVHGDERMMVIDSEENDGELPRSSRTGRSRKHSKDRDGSKEREKDEFSERRKEVRSEAEEVVVEAEEERHRDKERRRKREKDNKDRGKDYDHREPADYDKGKDRDRGRESYRDRDHERGKERHDLARDRDKDHDRGRDRDKDRDRLKHKEKEKEKEKEKHRDHRDNKDYVGRHKDKGKSREKESHRAKDRESDRRGKECDKDGRAKPDTVDTLDGGGIVAKRADEVEDKGSKDRDEKPSGSVSTSELEERLLRMKQDRLRKKSDDASEISSWVGKSRRLDDKRNAEKEKAARTSRQLEEQDNIEDESEDEKVATHCGKDLAGVKILHGLDKVIEGGAVVLTLKDSSILADGDINEEMDMLENVEIGEQKLRDEAYKGSKKRAGKYEDKFSDDTGSRTILPQYDDPIEDEGVTLDESGRFTGEAEKKLEELRKRIEGGSIKRTFEDLTSSGKNSSDYFTPDEMLQFKKPKKKKSLRKREKLDLDALEAEAKSAGLGTGDLGSRNDSKRQSAKEQEAKIEAEMRNSAYQSALSKAQEASKALRQEQTLTVKPMEDEDMVFGEDYEDLEKSLEQARKVALRRKEESSASGPHAVALMAIANKKEEDTQTLTTGESQENKVVITEMEEFVLGLQFNEETQNPDSEDVFKDDEDIPKSVQHEMKPDTGGWTEMKETLQNELPASEEKEDIVPDEIIHESAVGKGLSGALKLLKERGTLKEGIDWGGRNMDKKKSKLVGINNSDGPKEIRIERTDEFGRIMTPKEAFRVISHKFHGKGPGKMKQEKRMKQYQEDLKSKQMKASDTPSLAMERMREVQAQSKMPYLVISGHVKPGQTSDPRSGFATVERDHLGSLTPMLGDKKVEHFLGINRKPEKGSMGPPPPRKPNN